MIRVAVVASPAADHLHPVFPQARQVVAHRGLQVEFLDLLERAGAHVQNGGGCLLLLTPCADVRGVACAVGLAKDVRPTS